MKHETKSTVHPETIRFWVRQTFAFASSLLWPGKRFTPYEIMLAYKGIQHYYTQIPAEKFLELIETEFAAFCLRIAMYQQSDPENVPRPSDFFDPQNLHGIFYSEDGVFTVCGLQICLN